MTRHVGADRDTPDHKERETPLLRQSPYPANGTCTQPCISTRALRLMMALLTVHSPSTTCACEPTRKVPDGCPKHTVSRSPPPAARLTSVPGTAAAVAMATEAVPIM